jgi:predicted TPR repeat methyltransferase
MPGERPSSHSESEFIDEAYNLEDADSMAAFYRKWAADYDHQMLDLAGYTSPSRVAEILVEHLHDRSASILDVGCGTGLTCRLLAQQNYVNLDGVDLSKDMLAVAGERGIYRHLLQADLNLPLPLAAEDYDGVISSGTFTHGHVGPEPLHEIFRILKPGGILACTVHQDLWQSMGFETTFDELAKQGLATEVSRSLESYYRNKPVEGWFCVYRKT